MVVLAGLFGAAAGTLGTLLSQVGPRMPTGPLIVLAATAVFGVSLVAAPRRGLLARLIRLLLLRRQVAREGLLRALYELAEAAGRPHAGFPLTQLRSRKGVAAPTALLARVRREGLVAPGAAECWALTPAGLRAAHALVRERRLWEVFLMHEGELGGTPVDRDGAALNGPEAAALRPALERLLRLHGLEPALAPASPAGAGKGG